MTNGLSRFAFLHLSPALSVLGSGTLVTGTPSGTVGSDDQMQGGVAMCGRRVDGELVFCRCVEDYLDALKWSKSIGGLEVWRDAGRRTLNMQYRMPSMQDETTQFSPLCGVQCTVYCGPLCLRLPACTSGGCCTCPSAGLTTHMPLARRGSLPSPRLTLLSLKRYASLFIPLRLPMLT